MHLSNVISTAKLFDISNVSQKLHFLIFKEVLMKKFLSKFTAVILVFSFLSSGVSEATPKISNWAKPAYDRLYKKQIIPLILRDADLKQEITRREFTHILMAYMVANNGYNLETFDADIKDVEDDKYIISAFALGIVSGYPDGSFKPLMKIRRSEAAVMIYKAESLVRKVPDGSVAKFKDARFIPTWAKKAVGSMTSLGVMSGYESGNFIPARNISRQETIVMIDKLATGKASKLQDVYEIEKTDKFLSKKDYEFVLNNIPVKKFDKTSVKQYVFDTNSERRFDLYNRFIFDEGSTDKVISSPNLIFDYDKSSYVLGIEKKTYTNGKTEKRVFIGDLIENGKYIKATDKVYSPWVAGK